MSKGFLASLLAIVSVMIFAQESKPWTNALDLSVVGTGGNSESSTLGFNNDYSYKWEKAGFNLKAGAIRVENTRYTRYAEGSLEDFTLFEESETIKTDEKFFLKSRYDHTMSEKTFWYFGLDWDRNEFAGIANRYAASSGVGNKWIDTESVKFSTSYGLVYTVEDPVFEPEGYDDRYASLKLSYVWLRNLGKNISFKQDFDLAVNLEETDDYRADLKNSLSTSLNQHLALKVGLDFAFDNQPAFQPVPLIDNGVTTGTVAFELDNLDYIFTTSLSIKY